MSRAAVATEPDVEEVVVSRRQWASTLHRPDADSEAPRPACPQSDADDHDDYREAPLTALRPHYELCRNPECFGGEWR